MRQQAPKTLEKLPARNPRSDSKRWAAVCARDARFADAFVYAVKTTGIYCRCSCAAKTPKRGNVVFYDRSELAKAAGYRACKRCHPDAAAPAATTASLIARACRMIEESEQAPSLRALADAVELSPHHFHRLFKAATGLTPKDYWLGHCADKVRASLLGSGSVTTAVHEAGFHSTRQFYAKSNELLGMTPNAYRRGGKDTRIRFACGQCSLGAILVAATDTGICAVLLGDDPSKLVNDLEHRFPAAELTGANEDFDATVAHVIAFAEQPAARFDLPLDVKGTAFQQRVWKALRQIPPGKTVSYTEIAAKIGAPDAVRAVAGACAANPVAIIVPCHRVVRSDGALSGYRWGVDRKRTLLQREARRKEE